MYRIIAVLAIVALSRGLRTVDRKLDDHWNLFKKNHGKDYVTAVEETNRRLIWEDNVDFIQKHNLEYDLGKHSYFLGTNEYADWEHGEFVKTMNGAHLPNTTDEDVKFLQAPVGWAPPQSVDWRNHGIVTGVKNQLGCGSCWAFSVVGAMEGRHAWTTRRLVSLSEQQLVDCDHNGANGCKGGSPSGAMQYIASNGGIDTEASYGYKGVEGACHYSPYYKGATCRGPVNVQRLSSSALTYATATQGLISVVIDASQRTFQLFKGGIYNDPACKTQIDHAVLVVGYAPGYWIVKNSWGTSFGQGGYINIARGHNQCGILEGPVYPRM